MTVTIIIIIKLLIVFAVVNSPGRDSEWPRATLIVRGEVSGLSSSFGLALESLGLRRRAYGSPLNIRAFKRAPPGQGFSASAVQRERGADAAKPQRRCSGGTAQAQRR